jgi:hypothetical protein
VLHYEAKGHEGKTLKQAIALAGEKEVEPQ